MSFDPNKLVIIAENQEKIFNAGYTKGKAEGECKKTITSVIKPATCAEVGEANFICEGCGATGVTILPLAEHTYDENGICTFCQALDPYHINNYPIQDSLSGLFVLGETKEKSIINHSKNATTNGSQGGLSSKEGSITYADNYAEFQGHSSYRINTQVSGNLNNGITWIALYKISSKNGVIVSTRTGAVAPVRGLGWRNNNTNLVIRGKNYYEPRNELIDSDSFIIEVLTATPEQCRIVQYVNGQLDTASPVLEYKGSIDAWESPMTISIGGESSSGNVF